MLFKSTPSLSRSILTIMLLTTLYIMASAQSSHSLKRSADKAYKDEQYNIAEEKYRKALEQKSDSKVYFNLGNSVFQQNRHEEAAQLYDKSIAHAKTDAQRNEALYNRGNAQLKEGQLNEAVSSYKDAIRINPADREALQNLYIAKLLKQQEQQDQQQQQQNSEENPQEQNQDYQNESPDDQDSHQQSETNEQEESASQSNQMTRADAEKLLQVVENEDKNVQEKMKKSADSNKSKPTKDW